MLLAFTTLARRSLAVLQVTAVSLLLAIAVGLVGLHFSGRQLLSVQSGSMLPTLRRGDAVLVEPVSAAQLSAGDIVSYRSSQDPRVVITHRLIGFDHQHGILATAGDAQQDRPDKPVQISRLQGRVVAVAPGLGAILDFARTPLGLATMVYLPALVIVGQEFQSLAAQPRHPFYRLQPTHR